MVTPFVALLLCISLLPFFLKTFWERHYPKVAVGLGAISVIYYLAVLQAPARVAGVAVDYVSFMVVIGSLFVVSGGIHLRVKGEAKPWVNCVYLLIGAVLANVIGTTGASMLMIRPWIRMNKYRFTGLHIAFFIFFVSNVGGALTPVGPPLFLGYLKGVPFWWGMQRCWLPWLVTVGALLVIFYFLDRLNFLRAPRKVREAETAHEEWRADGLHNIVFMVVILVCEIVLPTGWRELALVVAAAASYFTTKKPVHEANHFTFGPIKEVGWLFIGIFATMVPVLDYMQLHAGALGIRSDAQFYWLSGLLSGVLDNAPTYLTFLAAAFGLEHLNLDSAEHMRTFIAHHDHYLVALSLGSTCFGALTYIGNGPNFMVKAIADHAKLHTPSFFGYVIKYSLPFLVPVFVLVTYLFFRK
jgi:Na+/H+ antiporter NhaD/arsenite permease-like protein